MKIDDLRSAGITRLRVHYSDLLGTTRAKVIPLELAEEAAEAGLNFCVAVFAIDHVGVMPDGTGLRDEVQFRDMTVVADLATARIVPWERDTAICLSDCYFDGGPLSADPRGILKRAIAEAEQRGLRLLCGHELEFFLFRRTRRGLERYATGPGLVYRMDPRVDPAGSSARWRTPYAASACPSSASTRSTTPLSGRSTPATTTPSKAADDAHLLKLAIKEIAAMHGLVATFMGRPMEGGTSGYHLHISAVDEQERNLFEDPDAEYGLSELARWFIGGVLAHGRGTTAVMAPTVNAYRRFIAQELAPYWINWGPDNRSVYVRIPAERGKGTRVECRGADGTASAYLASAAEIFAGLDGVERRLDPGPAAFGVYEGEGWETMPFTLGEALDALEADAYVRDKLGEQFVQAFVAIKRNEVRRFSLAVTDWEIREYLDAL